jgi:hypothetical protein
MALVNVVIQAICVIPINNYGLCRGSGGKSKNKPLTDWLAQEIELVGNKDVLTFKICGHPMVINRKWTSAKSTLR